MFLLSPMAYFFLLCLDSVSMARCLNKERCGLHPRMQDAEPAASTNEMQSAGCWLDKTFVEPEGKINSNDSGPS